MTQLTKNQLRALAGMPTVNEFEEEKKSSAVKQLIESEKYDGSIDFTHDFDTATKHLDDFSAIISSAKFNEWLKATDRNFDTEAVDQMREVRGSFKHLYDAWNDLRDELDEAG